MRAKSEAEENEYEAEILDQNIKYYKDNWEQIKPMWVLRYRSNLVTHGSNTNNIAESINTCLKQFIPKQTKMSRCLRKMLKFVDDQISKIHFDEFKEK